MNRLFGLIAGAVASFFATRKHTARKHIKKHLPGFHAGICNQQCRIENHASWQHLPAEDPRSSAFLSYLETAWFQDLTPEEAVGISPEHMERIMFGHANLLLDDLVLRGIMHAHEAEHLKSYYRAMIFRNIAQR